MGAFQKCHTTFCICHLSDWVAAAWKASNLKLRAVCVRRSIWRGTQRGPKNKFVHCAVVNTKPVVQSLHIENSHTIIISNNGSLLQLEKRRLLSRHQGDKTPPSLSIQIFIMMIWDDAAGRPHFQSESRSGAVNGCDTSWCVTEICFSSHLQIL